MYTAPPTGLASRRAAALRLRRDLPFASTNGVIRFVAAEEAVGRSSGHGTIGLPMKMSSVGSVSGDIGRSHRRHGTGMTSMGRSCRSPLPKEP